MTWKGVYNNIHNLVLNCNLFFYAYSNLFFLEFVTCTKLFFGERLFSHVFVDFVSNCHILIQIFIVYVVVLSCYVSAVSCFSLSWGVKCDSHVFPLTCAVYFLILAHLSSNAVLF